MRGPIPSAAKGMRFPGAWLAAGIAIHLAARAAAEEWAIIGPRAMGMGGAGVAVTRGGLSTYWNPAALAPPRVPDSPPYGTSSCRRPSTPLPGTTSSERSMTWRIS